MNYDWEDLYSVNNLAECEDIIKELYKEYKENQCNSCYKSSGAIKVAIELLLTIRKKLLDELFVPNEADFAKLASIRSTLSGLVLETRSKVQKVFEDWLATEEDKWRNDCNVEYRIFGEGWEEDMSDDIATDYAFMMELIEDMNHRTFLDGMFSNSPDNRFNPMESIAEINTDVDQMLSKTLYSQYDLLRISCFWSDVKLVHQRIVNYKGELL